MQDRLSVRYTNWVLSAPLVMQYQLNWQKTKKDKYKTRRTTTAFAVMTVQEWAVEIFPHREAWIFQFFGTQAPRICSIAPRTQEIKRGPSLHPSASSLNCNLSSYTLCQTTSTQKHQVKNPPTHRCWICFAWQLGYGWHHLSKRVKKLFQSMLAPVHCCPTNWN